MGSIGSRQRAGGRRASCVGLLAVALAAAGTTALADGVPSLPLRTPATPAIESVPSLPPQPGVRPGACTASPRRPGWSVVAVSSGAVQVFADPHKPCLLYRADDTTSLSRSTDARTWTKVFVASTGGVSPAFEMHSLALGADRSVWLGESGNGDAVVRSGDLGTTWELRNGGVAMTSVYGVLASPSSAAVVYLVATPSNGIPRSAPGVAVELFASRDAGRTWTQMTLPGPLSPALQAAADVTASTRDVTATLVPSLIQVDPGDPQRLWAVWPDPTAAATNAVSPSFWRIFVSTDGGASWKAVSPALPSGWDPYQLALVDAPSHPRRLAIAATGAPGFVQVTDDVGLSWQSVGGYPGDHPRIAVNPGDRNRVLLVPSGTTSGGGDVYVSLDGLDGASPVPFPRPWGTNLKFVGTGQTFSSLAAEPGSGDDDGDFYLNVAADCSGTTNNPLCPDASLHTAFVRLSLPAIGASSTRALPPATSQGAPPSGTGPQNRGPVNGVVGTGIPSVTERASCSVPTYGGPAAAPGTQGGGLAFDGRRLLYTNFGESGSQPNQGIIHTVIPGSPCTAGPDITVAFSTSDLSTWAGANKLPPTQHPWIDDLAFDPNRGVLWVSIGDDATSGQVGGNAGGGASTTGLFTVALAGTHAVARLAMLTGCGEYLTFDYLRDRIWTCDGTLAVPGSSGGPPSEISAANGSVIDSCVASIFASQGGSTQAQLATWHLASPHHVYVWNEDDVNIDVYNADTCGYEDTWSHRRFLEPLGEDEQMACDATTFGRGSPVLWVRDPQAFVIDAYPVPDNDCEPVQPADTSTRTIIHGSLVIPVASAEGPPPLNGQTPGAGGSSAQGPSQPAPAGQTQVQAMEQAQAQAQGQSQAQGQTSGVTQMQPGLMMQRQRRTAVAVQDQGATAQAAYHATKLHRQQPGPIAAVAAGALLLAFAFAARRPRWVAARAVRKGLGRHHESNRFR